MNEMKMKIKTYGDMFQIGTVVSVVALCTARMLLNGINQCIF